MDLIDELESESVYVIREAAARHARLALLWSMGKDSTALLWMCRKAFLGRVPFPVIHIDTGYKFKEMYAFRDRIAHEWELDLVVRRNEDAIGSGMNPKTGGTLACCDALKTQALADAVSDIKLDAVLLGIRRDEHGVRAKERYFSPRGADGRWDYAAQRAELWDVYESNSSNGERHVRVHPLLHMTELDVWRYTKRESIPVVDLYFDRYGAGSRFRSLGCRSCCSPTASQADSIDAVIAELEHATAPERAGRAQDKESAYLMQKLRTLGYM